jgi:hypothetical protein
VWNGVTSGVLIGQVPPDGVTTVAPWSLGAAPMPGPRLRRGYRSRVAGGSGTPCDSAARTSSRSVSAPRRTLGARSESVA